MPDNPALDRAAARERLAEKRARNWTVAAATQIRAGSEAADPPELRALLAAIASEIDEYLDTHAYGGADKDDVPTWREALAVARAVLEASQ
jgi:hypothetical protein